ncbi:hypothetical protein [Sphingomonas gei]|uniref:hypothetical protein n=1 Tax=Sphingomonas gei TaxID=1395960 RepID=UPI0014420DEC|nr:hypothetical protein [Sphingomonas gei]
MTLLHHSCRRGTARRGLLALAGWLALGSAAAVMSMSLGSVIGIAAVLLTFSLSGLLAVFLSAERRADRTKPARVAEPDSRPRSRWRGWARGMTAFFLAMFAALAVGAAFAGLPVGAPADRVSIGSLIVPFLWAALVIWALADRKILRPVIGMVGALAVSSAAIAWGLLA